MASTTATPSNPDHTLVKWLLGILAIVLAASIIGGATMVLGHDTRLTKLETSFIYLVQKQDAALEYLKDITQRMDRQYMNQPRKDRR